MLYILVSGLRSIKNDLFIDKIALVLGYNPWSVMVPNGKIAILDKNMRCFISRNKYIHQSPTYTQKGNYRAINKNKYLYNEFISLAHSEAETNGRYFLDIFNCIFWNENIWISIKSSLKFVPKGPINNIQALVQIMAWRRSGDRPLS